MPAPPNPDLELVRAPKKALVWLGEDDGERPVAEGETESLRLFKVMRSAGGQALDFAQFAVDLGRDGSRLVDLQTPEAWQRQIEVRMPDDDGEPTGQAIAWGELGRQTIGLSGPGKEEAASVVARIELWHFGRVLTGMRVRDPLSGDVVKLDMDPVFNPVVDGRIVRNRSTHLDPDHDYYLWVHPESVRTAAARTFQSETAVQSWTLPGIIFSLCWSLNGDETYISNPTRDELEALMGVPADDWQPSTDYVADDSADNGGNIYVCTTGGTSATSGGPTGEGEAITDGTVQWRFDRVAPDTPKIANFQIRRGAYLSSYLDAVLIPHGFGWYIDLSFKELTEEEEEEEEPPAQQMIRKIMLFRRGEGTEREIFHQRPGEDLDLSKSNVPELTVETSVADLANVVQGFGSYEEREITLELYRGWVEADDALTPDELDKEDPDSDYSAHPMAWRLWVANEAGDYTGTRSVVAPITGPPDITALEIFTLWGYHRRKIGDCLTLDATKKRRPPFVEWYDPEDGGTWKPVQPGSYQVLEHQIGIAFNGQKPPDDIASAGDNVRMRITGTVSGDARLFKQVTRRDSSPNGNDVVLMLDVADRFHDRKVQTTGDAASVLATPNTYGRDERDDGSGLEEYVGLVQDVEDCAQIRASFKLHGLHFEYQIGDLITRVAGRNISFNRLAESAEDKRYLQVTGIEHDWQAQSTVLRVEALDDEGYEADASFGEVTKRKWKRRKQGRRK